MPGKHRSVVSTAVQQAIQCVALGGFLVAALFVIAGVVNVVSDASGWGERAVIVGIIIACAAMFYGAVRMLGRAVK